MNDFEQQNYNNDNTTETGNYHYQYRSVNDNGENSNNHAYNYTTRQPKKKGGFGRTVKKAGSFAGKGLIFGLVAGLGFSGVSIAKDQLYTSKASQISVVTTDNVSGGSDTDKSASAQVLDISQTVDNVMPSVVSITCTVHTNSFFYGSRESQGAGSGFIIAKTDKELMIGTNNHVVDGATSLTVGFCDDTTAPATIVGKDSDSDLAVISVKLTDIAEDTAKVIKVAVLGKSEDLKVGQTVIAIGNALGYGQSVTTGVVSALDREVSFTDGTLTLLQTDAAINPGNSGGVLINTNGEVIGINNAKLEDTSVEGMGYAIPMSTAQTVLTDLMNKTEVKQEDEAYLGIIGKTIDSAYSQALGMPTGIYVTQVIKGSPAEAAGISAGDIITGMDDKDVSTMEGLKERISRKKKGDKSVFTLQRSNQNGEYEEQSLTVTLGRKGDFEDVTDTEEQTDPDQNNQNNSNNGNNDNKGYYGNGEEGDSQDNYGYDYDNGDNYFDPFYYFFGNGGNSFFR